jgi:hypothetical protein
MPPAGRAWRGSFVLQPIHGRAVPGKRSHERLILLHLHLHLLLLPRLLLLQVERECAPVNSSRQVEKYSMKNPAAGGKTMSTRASTCHSTRSSGFRVRVRDRRPGYSRHANQPYTKETMGQLDALRGSARSNGDKRPTGAIDPLRAHRSCSISGYRPPHTQRRKLQRQRGNMGKPAAKPRDRLERPRGDPHDGERTGKSAKYPLHG